MASFPEATPVSLATQLFWRTGRIIGVVATVALLAGLVLQPKLALFILWNVLIPLLPISFLIAPGLWRGLCPLATLNMLSNGLAGRRRLPLRLVRAASFLGIVLLLVLVPARRFLFNENGLALAATIIAVALAAIVLGAFFDAKAGFCNGICPVLPVEKLYGQNPLLDIADSRCGHCTLCVPKGCLDLAPTNSITPLIGPTHRPHQWLLTIYGAFAAAFPGFVAGYYTTTDASPADAGAIYLHIAACMACSYVVTALLVLTLKLKSSHAFALLAAAALVLYYWFAAPIIASALLTGEGGNMGIRAAALTVIVFWLWRAVGRSSPEISGLGWLNAAYPPQRRQPGPEPNRR